MLKASITLLKYFYFVDQSDTESNLLNTTFMRHLAGKRIFQASFVGKTSPTNVAPENAVLYHFPDSAFGVSSICLMRRSSF